MTTKAEIEEMSNTMDTAPQATTTATAERETLEELEEHTDYSLDSVFDSNLADIKHEVYDIAENCKDVKVKLIMLNLLRFAEELRLQADIPTVRRISKEAPEGVVSPNVARYCDVLYDLTSCLTNIYYPECDA
ncbi:MAG: hypothetical protein RR214_01775 [Synergistaceae bacterium]